MKLGEIIREYRLNNHMSMGDFAKASGISIPYVSMLEADKNSNGGKPIVPSVSTLQKVSKATGISLESLLQKLGDTLVEIKSTREKKKDENSRVGELLKKRRAELSLTQRQVANQVGVTEATISRWESGDIDNMRRDKIASLANALSVSPLLIMGIDDAEPLYKPINGEELEVLDEYRELDTEDKNFFLGMLKRLNFARPKTADNLNVVQKNYKNSGGTFNQRVTI